MYITLNNIKGESRIDLSYSVQNCDSDKEIAVIRMLSDNVKYEILKLRSVMDPISDMKKMIPNGTYASRELISMLEGIIEHNQFETDDQVTKTNKLKGITEIILNLDELNNSDNLKDGRPSNELLTYYVTSNEDFTRFEPQTPEYRKLKNGEFTSLNLRITDQNNNVITDGPQVTVVLHVRRHIHDCKYNPLLKIEYGKRLNPERSLRTPKGIKGIRQKVIVTHNPSEIDQAQELLVKFPNLGSDDVIIPGTTNLSFNIELTSTVDANRTLVSTIGRAIIKKLAVKFEGNEIMSVDDFNVLACYRDLWKTKSEKKNTIRQGIISNECMENCIKLRINAGNKDATNAQDKAIADGYGNKFIIPLDFEMLDSATPYYQAGLGNRLCYELTFNDYKHEIV